MDVPLETVLPGRALLAPGSCSRSHACIRPRFGACPRDHHFPPAGPFLPLLRLQHLVAGYHLGEQCSSLPQTDDPSRERMQAQQQQQPLPPLATDHSRALETTFPHPLLVDSSPLERFSRLHSLAPCCHFSRVRFASSPYLQSKARSPDRLLPPCHPSSLLPLTGNLVSTPNLQKDTHWQPVATFPQGAPAASASPFFLSVKREPSAFATTSIPQNLYDIACVYTHRHPLPPQRPTPTNHITT
ncbi:hypothetical protein Krac_9249 [Ktedonobacter racemifer DSM 44963]|uniref:Uncharacterized protein n=1 Tax=Ktedonobacter racemifer DSM 44963 TaxID=485913 RepID=D6TBB4_KTERA|nr:hypothetical protein Krac_9249 [Ktedonobacter racemifer DSM 44963]